MNEMRKLIEAVEKLDEAYGIANDEVEQHIEEAAKALAKDAVLQAVGVWNEEGDGEGRFQTDARNAKEYVSIAAPRFLDDEYKQEIMDQFEEYFHQYVSYFKKYLDKGE